jgi:hypothetical protein
MDFTFTTEQDEAAALAARILKDRATNERMKQVEERGDRYDHDLWQDLADAGLLGLALPEKYGGAGLGLIELCRVLVEVGRTVAPFPWPPTPPALPRLPSSGPTTNASCGCTALSPASGCSPPPSRKIARHSPSIRRRRPNGPTGAGPSTG